MRVLLVTNMYPSAEEPWFGSFVHEQAEDLRALGVSMEIFSFDGRRSRRSYFRAMRSVRGLVRTTRFDLIHAHYGLSGAVAMAQRRLPVLTTFHGSDTGYIRWQGYVSWIVARRTNPLFVSEFTAERVGCRAAPVVPAGVDTDLFSPQDRMAARRTLGWSESGTYVLFPGARTNLRKRPDLFESALSEARSERTGLEAVYLEGFSRPEVALVMNAVDVMLMTSDWEGSPVAVREALACMTPVVSVPVADVPDVLADLPGCTVAPREPAELARGVLRALESERRPELRQRAEQTSRRRVAERVLEIYGRIVENRGRAPGTATRD